MAKTIAQLLAQSNTVKNATQTGENTATRVGGLFKDIVEYLNDLPSGGGGGGDVSLNEPLSSINNLGSNPTSDGMGLVWNGSSWGFASVGHSGEEGGISLNDVWQSLAGTDRTKQINPAHLSNLFSSTDFTNAVNTKVSEKMATYTWWGRHLLSSGSTDITGSLSGNIDYIQFSNNIRLGVDTSNNALKVYYASGSERANFYATGGVSALGPGSDEGGGGGGGVTLNQPLSGINSASLGEPSGENKAIVWNGSAWVYKTVSEGTGGSVAWGDITDKPSWIGTTKPSYTASEVGAWPTSQKFTTSVTVNGNTTTVDNNGNIDLGTISGGGEVVTGVTGIRVGTSGSYQTGNVSLPAYPTSLPASDVYSWAKQSSKPSYSWSEITDKPTIPSYSAGTTSTSSTDTTDRIWSASVLNNRIAAWGFIKSYTDTNTTYKLTLNGTQKGTSGGTDLGTFYAPTTAGSAGEVLLSQGSNDSPTWGAQSGLSVGSATTATKLSTVSKTAWGQTYWTSGGVPDNISGNMTNVGTVTPSANKAKDLGSPSLQWSTIYTAWLTASSGISVLSSSGSVNVGPSTSSNIALAYLSSGRGIYDNISDCWLIKGDGNTELREGNVGIGMTPSSSYKLDVNGTIHGSNVYSDGAVTALSDKRKKNIIEEVRLSSVEVANAPAVKFTWKDGRDMRTHVGTTAQYWKEVLPEAVTETDDGTLALDYGATALTAVISMAKEIESLKATVKGLVELLKDK